MIGPEAQASLEFHWERRRYWHNRAVEAEARVQELELERQAVLDCINLYGDEALHKALDGIGFLASSPSEGGVGPR